jgi:hypothetical protein
MSRRSVRTIRTAILTPGARTRWVSARGPREAATVPVPVRCGSVAFTSFF